LYKQSTKQMATCAKWKMQSQKICFITRPRLNYLRQDRREIRNLTHTVKIKVFHVSRQQQPQIWVLIDLLESRNSTDLIRSPYTAHPNCKRRRRIPSYRNMTQRLQTATDSMNSVRYRHVCYLTTL
jgi:hypothetical protein